MPISINATVPVVVCKDSERNKLNEYKLSKLALLIALKESETKQVISKNIEKANDRIKQRIANNEEISMSEDEAARETNWSVRENTNETVQNLTEIIRVNAAGILRGVYVVDEKIVDRQTVQVTIRWDKDSERAGQYFRNQWRK